MDAPPDFSYGQIVIVDGLLDPQGRNPKTRACVVVTPTDFIFPDRPLDVVAITTLLPDPLPEDHVLLPWHAQGHRRTGLSKRCAAVCSWLDAVDFTRIVTRIGFVPADRMVGIAVILAKMDPGR